MELVLDASVIIKWFLRENFSEEAVQLQDQHLKGEVVLVAPTILPFEIVNVLCTKPKVDLDIVCSAISILYFTGITEYILTKKLANVVATLSKNYKISAYDAAYVALAQHLGCQFITADKKLYRKVESLKFVKLLD